MSFDLSATLALIDNLLAVLGGVLPQAAFADLLVKIIQKGVKAYEDQTGQPIDPSLIKPIDEIP